MLDIYRTKRKKQAIKQKGVREVLDLTTAIGTRFYKTRTYEMEKRQNFRCAICERTAGASMQFDHQDGRGMGGSNRDDRIVDDRGNWLNAALCHACNSEKGSKRYEWLLGKYMPRQEK